MLLNRAAQRTSTTGTGNITLGAALESNAAVTQPAWLSFSAAGAAENDIVRYLIFDGAAWEYGLGTCGASAGSISRAGGAMDGTVAGQRSSTGSLLNLSGSAVVFISAIAEDFYTTEQAQDAVGSILVDSSTIDLTYNDSTPSITASVIDASITYAKIQNVSNTSRFLGRISLGAGSVEELSGTQATTLLDIFTSSLKGLAPASGGGTTTYLRADGTWGTPPGVPGGSDTQVQFNDAGSFGGDADLTWNKTTNLLTITGAGRATNYIQIGEGSIANNWASFPANLFIYHNPEDRWGQVLGTIGNHAWGHSIFFIKNRNASDPLAITTVNADDEVGNFNYYAPDGVAWRHLAQETIEVDGSPSSNMPGRFRWWTRSTTEISPQEKMRLDGNGRLILGGSPTQDINGANPRIQLHGTNYESGLIGQYMWSNTTNSNFLYMNKSRGTSIGTHVIVNNNDLLGGYAWAGSNGTDFIDAAYITAEVDGTPGVGNDMPGRLRFWTSPDGSGTPAVRMVLNSAGGVQVNAFTSGQVASSSTGQLSSVDDLLSISMIFDGGGSVVTTGIKGDIEVPFACTIMQATLAADQTGSIVIDIWKDSYANYPAVVGDSITASAKPTLSSALKSQDSTLTGWTTAIAAGDILRFNVDSAATVTRVLLSLKVKKTY